MIIAALKQNILENCNLLHQLTPQDYVAKNTELNQATIGEHIRHVIELLNCLLDTYHKGMVNYDTRKRDLLIQTDKNSALKAFEKQLESVEKPNKSLELHYHYQDQAEVINSTYYRELLYNLEHSIHHQALMKVALRNLAHVAISENFGTAPSTIAYKAQCAL